MLDRDLVIRGWRADDGEAAAALTRRYFAPDPPWPGPGVIRLRPHQRARLRIVELAVDAAITAADLPSSLSAPEDRSASVWKP